MNRQIKKPTHDRMMRSEPGTKPKSPVVKNADDKRIRQVRSRKDKEG